MQSRGDSIVLCVLCGSLDCRIYIADTKTTCCPWLQNSPLQAASQLNSPVWPSRWQLLWTTVSPQLHPMPKACVKLIQYHRLYGCFIPLLQWAGRRDMVLLQFMITLFTWQMDTEIGTRLWTWVKAPLQSAAVLYGRWGERGVRVNGHKVNQQSCT